MALMVYAESRTDLRDKYQLPPWGTMEGNNRHSNEFSACQTLGRERLHDILHPSVTDSELEREFVNRGFGTAAIFQQRRLPQPVEDLDVRMGPSAVCVPQLSVYSSGVMRYRRPSDDEEDSSVEKYQRV